MSHRTSHSAMVWTAWSNENKVNSGAGYGFRIRRCDRDEYFDRVWENVSVVLPFRDEDRSILIAIAHKGFWVGRCQELRSKHIGEWLLAEGHAPWSPGCPPKCAVTVTSRRRFTVHRIPQRDAQPKGQGYERR